MYRIILLFSINKTMCDFDVVSFLFLHSVSVIKRWLCHRKRKTSSFGTSPRTRKKVHGLETKNLVLEAEAEFEVLEKRKLELEANSK